DIHNSLKLFHGKDESNNWKNFVKIIKNEKPNLVLTCGDNGDINEKDYFEFREILKNINANYYMIYGNHDNFETINSGYNNDGSPFLLPEGTIIEYQKITIAGIPGIKASKSNKPWRHIREDFQKIGEEIKSNLVSKGNSLDILLTHEFPFVQELYNMEDTFYFNRSSIDIGKEVELLAPKIAISGHLHGNENFKINYKNGIIINLMAFTDGEHYLIMKANNNPFSVREFVFK
ncbi:MAG: metallophosphoesterase, partial [Candidatus Aenigmatarchaeota archaeon]